MVFKATEPKKIQATKNRGPDCTQRPREACDGGSWAKELRERESRSVRPQRPEERAFKHLRELMSKDAGRSSKMRK